jgi:hypothetical protein
VSYDLGISDEGFGASEAATEVFSHGKWLAEAYSGERIRDLA